MGVQHIPQINMYTGVNEWRLIPKLQAYDLTGFYSFNNRPAYKWCINY